MSNITLDTIRSLDASKTYYLANSTGQIKEAGAWQRFKCYFGILATLPHCLARSMRVYCINWYVLLQ